MNTLTLQCCAAAVEGVAGVAIGNHLYGKTKKYNNLTNFQRVLFSVGFVYLLLTFTETIRFFADYLIPGSTLQHYDLNPIENMLFLKLLGNGKAGSGQYPLIATDLRYFCLMISALLAGILQLLFYENRSKKCGDHNGLMDDRLLPETGFRLHLQSVRNAFNTEITKWEYLFWWVTRICFIWAIVYTYKEDHSDAILLQLRVNCAITFLVPLLRIIGYHKLFFGKLPLHVQSLIDLLVFAGSFLGQGLGLNSIISEYDKYMHLLTGGVCALIGYLIIRSTRRGDCLSPGVCTAASCGFSCMVSFAWEVFEFFADYYMNNSMNQNWEYRLQKKHLFVHIFGFGSGNPQQSCLVDTNLDILSNLVGCLFVSAVLYYILTYKLHQKNNFYNLKQIKQNS